ncbi:MAG: DctP family TRAP transporter solute-binding subunit [Firmicutes bacterium]|jgi:tripartite ATP-independent transporter DctP family solute receptor|nr:DctP family TRAP transporter solute-binding subunit [Bacillota bacterium]
MMKRLAILVLVAIMGTLAFGGMVSAKLKAEYKLTTNVQAATIWGQGADKFAELVRERTKGAVNIKVYHNAVLTGGDQMRQAEMVKNGAIDMMLNSTINIAPTIGEFNVFALPFLFPSYEAVDAAVASPAGERLFQILEKYNMIGLGWGENGFRELTNNVRPIVTPDDLKGLKIRVTVPIYVDIFRALGANPIAMQWGEVFTALQTRTIDGQENPIAGIIIPTKVYEVQKYLTDWHYSYDALVLAVNKDSWATIDPANQEIVRQCAKEAMEFEVALSRSELDKGLKFLAEKGMHITHLTPAQQKVFRDKTADVYNKWAEKVGLDIVREFEKAVASTK